MEKQSTNLQNKIICKTFFSIDHTLQCGQIFRYFINGSSYYVPYNNSIIMLRQKKNIIEYQIFGEKIDKCKIEEFLGINHDIENINNYLLQREYKLKEIVSFSKGLRIIKTPPYETVISFIFSIQNSIPVITKKLNLLSEIAGESVIINGRKFYTFPKSSRLRSLTNADYQRLRIGYREKFLREFIGLFNEDDFKFLEEKSYDEKRRILLSIKGVGEKVAQCVLLFGFSELSAFPVDVWIERALWSYFGVKGSIKKLTEFGRETFGDYAGYAQEYLYRYIRIKNIWFNLVSLQLKIT